MRLRKVLTDFIRVVADETERNPEFANRLASALGLAEQPKSEERDTNTHSSGNFWPKNRRPPAVLDPIEIARQSENALRARLALLSIEQLKDIVAQFGMDPGKLVAKWKTADRIVERIVETSMARAQKGDAFRTESKARVGDDD